MIQFLSIIFFLLGFLQFLLGFSKVPFFFLVSFCIITSTCLGSSSGREWGLLGGAGQGALQEAPVAPRHTIQRQNTALRPPGKASCQQKYLVSLFRVWPPAYTLKHFGCQ